MKVMATVEYTLDSFFGMLLSRRTRLCGCFEGYVVVQIHTAELGDSGFGYARTSEI